MATTRTGRRLEDQPTRVEVLGREEIEEKMLMTPGDIVMMLNEMGGLRVQATSPSIGAASVRVQGMKGRYTRFLSDGLPLFGQQVGGLGLLQIPPMDLGQVEVIKGAASALYGAGAMGGVVNLLVAAAGRSRSRELLVNQSTLGATDGVVFVSSPLQRTGWSALAARRRSSAEPRTIATTTAGPTSPAMRAVWCGRGCSGMAATAVRRSSRPESPSRTATAARCRAACCRPPACRIVEALDTRRYDVGGTVQTLAEGSLRADGARGGRVAAPRSPVRRHRSSATGTTRCSAKLALRGAAGRHTWVAGARLRARRLRPARRAALRLHLRRARASSRRTISTLAPWLSLSAGARVDFHDEYGTFFSPRVAALFRPAGGRAAFRSGGASSPPHR